MTKLIIRSHGGLGNQLFQIYFARAYADAKGLIGPFILHDANYPHRFALARELSSGYAPTGIEKAICKLKLPKVLEKARVNPGILRLPGVYILDGYFQDVNLYRDLPVSSLQQGLTRLRNDFGISPPSIAQRIVHVRLGDFFPDEASQLEHLSDRVRVLSQGDQIISNRDDILDRPQFSDVLAESGVSHIRTGDFTASDVLRLMSEYQFIDTNNSTLAFWAAILSGSDTVFTEQRLRSMFEFLRSL